MCSEKPYWSGEAPGGGVTNQQKSKPRHKNSLEDMYITLVIARRYIALEMAGRGVLVWART